jgi:hypothetical protein
MHKFTLETRGEVSVLICSHCKRPFADIENGQVRFKSKHGSSEHENLLTIDHLRMLAVAMYTQLHPPRPPESW